MSSTKAYYSSTDLTSSPDEDDLHALTRTLSMVVNHSNSPTPSLTEFTGTQQYLMTPQALRNLLADRSDRIKIRDDTTYIIRFNHGNEFFRCVRRNHQSDGVKDSEDEMETSSIASEPASSVNTCKNTRTKESYLEIAAKFLDFVSTCLWKYTPGCQQLPAINTKKYHE